MPNKKINLKEAIEFHGHLGPYLVLGLLAGKLALKKLKAKRYFGVEVKVYGANKKPKSCLIDGLQLSTGATYGKGNIHKFLAQSIKIIIRNLRSKKSAIIGLNKALTKRLSRLEGHRDSEKLAAELLKLDHQQIFTLNEE